MKDIDFPILIEGLVNRGITVSDIAKVTGVTRGFISQVRNETRPAPESWQAAAKLIDLHFKHNPTKHVPIYGEHNEP